MKKTLLIIKSKPNSLGNVEGFLRNREWKVKSTTNLKEALIFLVQEQPLFVMVSIDHPNRKVRHLPKILSQAFPVCVIAFAEETSAASYNLLSASATEYLVYPPVTGPAIERTVNKYYKDMQTKGLTPGQMRPPVESNDDDGVISIRGDSAFSAQNAQSVLAQMLNGDETNLNAGIPAPQTKAGSSLGYIPGENSPKDSGGPIAHGHGAGQLHNNMFDTEDVEILSALQNGNNKNSPGWAPVENLRKKTKERPSPEQIEDDPLATKKDSIILKGTKDALEKSCVVTDFKSSQPIEESTNVSCIMIESNRFSGYLVTAMGKDKKIDATFIATIRDRLFRFLKDNGEQVQDNDSMNLNIREVPFEDWALQYAEFLRKSIHEGHEVAMAFFPRTNVKTQYGESVAEEMAAIKLDELTGDVAVEFNVYIHLPRNNKYVLYTPRGSVFYNIQKERLQNQGVQNLHVLKGELQDLDKYRAQNFLNDKIQEFQDKENSKIPTKESA